MRARPVRFSVSTGLRLCGIAELPFWPGAKYSSASSTSVRCRWRTSTASRSIDEAITPSVAKNIAWRSRGMTWVETGSGFRPSSAATCSSTVGGDVGEGADRAGDRAGGDVLARGGEAVAVAAELGIGLGELEPEGDRLGVDAVAAADGRRQLVLEGAALEHVEQRVDVGEQDVGGLLELHRQRGVEHVGAGHALVQPALLRPQFLAGPGEEGDHVMLGHRLDRVDRRHVDLAERVVVIGLADRRRVLGRDHADLAHRLGREHLDLPPDAVAVFGRPDGRHLGAGIAGNHARAR